MSDSPIVFISHASEDKERFVLDFARKLRQRGIDVWLDQWEMYPGDSLIVKIFDEGLKKAMAVVVVLSKNSIAKPWVKEELNAAVVKRIQTGCPLIPVVLDECEVPEALKTTVWVKIADPANYGTALDRIVAAINGHRDKPVLGPPPAYVSLEVEGIAGMTKIDFLVLREFARRALLKGDLSNLDTQEVWTAVGDLGISLEDFRDACTILCGRFMLKPAKIATPEPPFYTITEHGLDHYLKGREPEFWEQFERACFAVLNGSAKDSDELAATLAVDPLRARLILMVMRRRNYIRLSEGLGGYMGVAEILPGLRRALSQASD